MTESQALGATRADWSHWDLALGLGGDLLPVVPDPDAVPASYSAIKKFGKIPSVYDKDGYAHGLKDWQNREVYPSEIEQWSKDDRLALCVRSRAVQAIDVDLTDHEAAAAATDILRRILGDDFTHRYRTNSPKFLVPVHLPGAEKKRIIDAGESGRIELLTIGQQFLVSGAHESGVRYQWNPGPPNAFPVIEHDQLETLWAELTKKFAVDKTPKPSIGETAKPSDGVRTEITDEERADLFEALAWQPLLKAAGANEVWAEVGYSLLSLGAPGRALFLAFSRNADNYTEGAPELWLAEHENQIPRADFRHVYSMARRLGWGARASLEQFPIAEPPSDLIEAYSVPDAAVSALSGEAIPDVNALCSDQMNAKRIAAHYGHKLVSVGRSFYVYDGRRWVEGDNEAARCIAYLNQIVGAEARAARDKLEAMLSGVKENEAALFKDAEENPRSVKSQNAAKANATVSEIMDQAELAEALQKWSKYCAMEPAQTKVLAMVRRFLDVSIFKFNTQHHLFNCANGTIDLRTGVLRPHDPKDFLTHMSEVEYHPDAPAPLFRNFIVDVLDAERAAFMQRWLGYCITGETREQKVVLHIGDGSNGKGTICRLLDRVMGTYYRTAAPELLTSDQQRHPTEIADLFGRRVIIAHESNDGANLREGFIKQLTGEDKMMGRLMFKDFFEFQPTCKIQLLTNHHPTVKGSDFGIWRRLILMNYTKIFGTAEQIAKGKANALVDEQLTQRMLEESSGILAWLVEGAKEWYARGLRTPDSVIHASESYREEQDRISQFVKSECIVSPDVSATLANSMGALYPAYAHWCKQCGFHALGMVKFSAELRRVVPSIRNEEVTVKVGKQYRKKSYLRGIIVNTDGDGGSFQPVANNEDLL